MAERFMSYESFRGETVKKFLHCHGIPGTGSGNNGLYAAQRENFEAEKAGTETGNPDSRRAAVAEAHSRKYSPSAAAARMAGGDQWRVGDRAVPLIESILRAVRGLQAERQTESPPDHQKDQPREEKRDGVGEHRRDKRADTGLFTVALAINDDERMREFYTSAAHRGKAGCSSYFIAALPSFLRQRSNRV
jgi:hypothetical protein